MLSDNFIFQPKKFHFFRESLEFVGKMWHEARRQEKMVRAKMVDNAKRNERRKQFYESVRKEPEGFMQLHGQRMLIHVDPTEVSTDSHNAMRKWQGDPNVLIDRFDVRVYLDTIPEIAPNSTINKNIPKDDVIELQCDYERYRILVFNEFRRVNEKQFLSEIAAKEFWPAQQQSSQAANVAYKKEIEKKRKSASKRAAIAFNYADSTEGPTNVPSSGQQFRESPSSSDEEDFDEMEEIDTVLDANVLTAEQAATLNKIGAHFNISSGAFLQLLSLDRKEQTSTAQIREIDKAKLALSGRNAKADRALLKRKRALIIGNLGANTQNSEEATTTLLSFLAASGKNQLNDDSSSSESGEDFVKTEFITSFGGDEERQDMKRGGTGDGTIGGGPVEEEGTDDKEAVVQGPILPNREYRRLLELSRRRSNSPENAWERRNHRPEERGRGDTRHGTHRRPSRSLSHRRRRRTTRSRERERRRRGSRSRSRNSGRQRRRHTSSTASSHSPSPRRTATTSISQKTVRHGKERGRSTERERNDKVTKARGNSSSSSSRNHSHKVGNGSAKFGLQSPYVSTARKSSSSSDESDSLLSVRSSMSESEKEQIERENRKRRIRKTKRSIKEQQQQANIEIGQDEAENKAERAAKKLRQQMQKALTKTAAQLKEEEAQRQREMLREKKKREEQLLEESRLLRKREREKRKTDDGRERERRESDACSVARRRRRSSPDD